MPALRQAARIASAQATRVEAAGVRDHFDALGLDLLAGCAASWVTKVRA